MQALNYLLPQPPFNLGPEQRVEFDHLFDSTPSGGLIHYQLPYPKWQFLSYLSESRNLVLHGSQNQAIEEVKPQKAEDIKAFSDQKAIYATTDGIWVIYFAIIDRKRFTKLSLFNSCLHIRLSPEYLIGPLYFFSITHSVLLQEPWCEGAVYILERESFLQEPAQQMQGVEIVFPHWISTLPAKPVARLLVKPDDFPFLSKVHGHNDEKLSELAAADPNGFPWAAALDS